MTVSSKQDDGSAPGGGDRSSDSGGSTPSASPANTKIQRRDVLRAEVAKLKNVSVKRSEAVPDAKDVPGSKAHVVATWANKRVTHVVEPPFDADDAEIAVLTVVLAQHAGA